MNRPLKYTLCVTQRCNLACSYCYIAKSDSAMTLEVAQKIVAFIFRHAKDSESIEIGFFGGEPLLEFELVRKVTESIESHQAFRPDRVSFTITTNGTIFTHEVACFLSDHSFKVCISCDGPPHVQNLFRRTRDNKDSAKRVERTVRTALANLPMVLANAVFHPRTLQFLPETVDYLSSLGLRQIYLNPDYSAVWSREHAEQLPYVYEQVGQRYLQWYCQHDPHFISLIDSKVAVLLRGGYQPLERCQMGRAEMAFTADGGIYPCERLIQDGISNRHRIGNVDKGIDLSKLSCTNAPKGTLNQECLQCGLRNYCMNWCGCSNVFMTGYYNRVGPILCASEKASILTSMHVFEILEKQLGALFVHHLSGSPQVNSRGAGTGAGVNHGHRTKDNLGRLAAE